MNKLDAFKDIMPSISKKNNNLLRENGIIDNQRAKELDKSNFLMKRFFSYAPDCLFYVAEIDACWNKKFDLQPGMVYDYLYNCVPKGYKQIKWARPKKQDNIIKLITESLSCSDKKAKELLMFLSDSDIKQLEQNGKI